MNLPVNSSTGAFLSTTVEFSPIPSAKPLSLLQAALRTARGAQPPLRSPMRLLLGEPLRTL
jgi:hypothetical protein